MKNFIIPSIDLLDGKIVRLLNGDYNKSTIYDVKIDDLVEKYSIFNTLHIVDLNGAKGEKCEENGEIIAKIRAKFKGKIQVGGGFRDVEKIEFYLNKVSVDAVVLGTLCIKNVEKTIELIKKFGAEKIILAIDCENVNGVYVMNTYDIYPTALYAEQYAFQLAHSDTSMASELVNSRMMDIIIAHNNSNAENAKSYLSDIYRGKFSYITDKTEELEIDRTPKGVGHIKDYIDVKDRFLKDSYETFGIKKLAEKRERMISGEVESTSDLLNLNLKEMLDCRIKMCEDINKLYGLNCSVKSHVDMDGDGKTNEKEFEDKGVNENV